MCDVPTFFFSFFFLLNARLPLTDDEAAPGGGGRSRYLHKVTGLQTEEQPQVDLSYLFLLDT